MDELERINKQIASLKAQLNELESKRQALMASATRGASHTGQRLAPEQKVAIFRRYFKGNENCFARRWQSAQGRSGYAIACSNEWQQGLCNKPKVKCLECPNQAFRRFDDEAIYSHLTGEEVVGLYPIMPDNTCWLLAIDFDKSDWQQAARAYVDACKHYGIDCLLERSRSGKGAHVWVFFETAIEAKTARQLGFLLLDKAMMLHGTLSFDSYDRLFPNQDILPLGGIGNLIALPLQKQSRAMGNTVFVDDNFDPYKDPWEALSSVVPVSASMLDKLISDDLSGAVHVEDWDVKPWERVSQDNEPMLNCPKTLEVVMANRLYLQMTALPNPLITKLKRLASFSNPKFFKAQGLRLSTNGISRFICLAEIDNGYLSLPRGCWEDVKSILNELGIRPIVSDKRYSGTKLEDALFVGDLRKDQHQAIDKMMEFDSGVLHAPTAFGKTVTAIGLICRRAVNTLVLVHNKQLVDQWHERLNAFSQGISVGVYTGTKKKLSGQVDIATYQSLINKRDNSVNALVQKYGQIIVDECHHLSAPQYERVLSEANARYTVGISATLERRDGHQPIIFMQTGKVRHSIKSNHRHHFVQTLERKDLNFAVPLGINNLEKTPHISDIYRWLMEHSGRNKLIVGDIQQEVLKGRVPIVLTERREHAVALGNLLGEAGISHQVLLGAMNKKSQQEVMSKLATTQVLVATGRFVGEGFDLPRLDTLILALPVSWKGSLIQYVGRVQREFEGKTEVKVIDYVDGNIPMLARMYKKREKGYRALGFSECTQLELDD